MNRQIPLSKRFFLTVDAKPFGPKGQVCTNHFGNRNDIGETLTPIWKNGTRRPFRPSSSVPTVYETPFGPSYLGINGLWKSQVNGLGNHTI